MFNYRIMAIIKREVREKLLSRTFIFMTILFPFLMFGGIGIQLALHQDEAVSKIAIVTENATLTQSFQKDFGCHEKRKTFFAFFYNESSGIKNLSRCKEKGLA